MIPQPAANGYISLKAPVDNPKIVVRLSGVTCIYNPGESKKRLHALGPVNLNLHQGEFFTVVGPSGCGKSTLLDVLAGLSAPTDGTAEFEGKPIAGVPDGVGVVFQEDACFPWLTVDANIAFGLRRAGIEPPEIKRRVDYALGFMGLREFRNAYPAQLSGGMRQRVCIARTLVLKPRFILLDEPFGALDQQTRLIMGEELLRLWRETGATVLLITHSLDEAAMLSDRVGVMSARPGVFIDTIKTDWLVERSAAIISDPHFDEIRARIWDKLYKEAVRQMSDDAPGQA